MQAPFDLYFECRRGIKIVVIDKASKNLLQFDDLITANLQTVCF